MICLLSEELRSEHADHKIPMERFYEYFKISRQGYSKKLLKYNADRELEQILREDIINYRSKIDRRAGGRSLYYNLKIKESYGLGINKFERIVSDLGLSLVPLRIKVVTTQSCHQSWNYENLCNGLDINGINQLIVGDITYLYLGGIRFYLFCLTDVFSGRIVGHCISKRMRTQEALKALERCKELRGEENLKNCIHHTDGGSQYFAKIYLATTKFLKLQMSVARTCLENAYAEQKNGLIKSHLIPTMKLTNLARIDKKLEKIMTNYNQTRKQKLLGWLSPVEFEAKLGNKGFTPKIILHDYLKKNPSKRIGF